MRNDVLIRVTEVRTGKKQHEIHFDYYNTMEKYVGNITINSNGEIKWIIINALYSENIFSAIKEIYENEYIKLLEYCDKNELYNRWINAREYIKTKGYYVNRLDRTHKSKRLIK